MIHKAGKIVGKRQYCSACKRCIIVQSKRKGSFLQKVGKLLGLRVGHYLSPGQSFLHIKHIPITESSVCSPSLFDEVVDHLIGQYTFNEYSKRKYGPKINIQGSKVQVNRLQPLVSKSAN